MKYIRIGSCEDCIHNEVCLEKCGRISEKVERFCTNFKDKSEWVHPPCKVGDIVYTNFARQGWYLKNKDKPYSGKVVFIGLNDSKEMGFGFINVLYNDRNGCVYQFNFSDIGKIVFITREEAENHLRI